jgi:hypothetical protein
MFKASWMGSAIVIRSSKKTVTVQRRVRDEDGIISPLKAERIPRHGVRSHLETAKERHRQDLLWLIHRAEDDIESAKLDLQCRRECLADLEAYQPAPLRTRSPIPMKRAQ